MKSKSHLLQIVAVFFVVCLISVTCAIAQIGPTTTGTWALYPEQGTSYFAVIQQPINADGTSSFKHTGRNVIPIKFKLSTSPGPVILQSILSDSSEDNDYSYLSFTPGSALTFNQITNLSAVYNFTEGNCHGGALRWSVRVSDTQSVFIYYGSYPNFTECVAGAGGTVTQSGINIIGRPELRYDLTQLGGPFYGSYEQAQALVGTMPIVRVSLVLDGGWAGDQKINPISNATVNDNTFIPQTGPVATCDLPPATIQITKIAGSEPGAVSEPISIQPKKDDLDFRIIDCKYLYNLATSSLYGPGKYKVEVVIDGVPAAGPAIFELR